MDEPPNDTPGSGADEPPPWERVQWQPPPVDRPTPPAGPPPGSAGPPPPTFPGPPGTYQFPPPGWDEPPSGGPNAPGGSNAPGGPGAAGSDSGEAGASSRRRTVVIAVVAAVVVLVAGGIAAALALSGGSDSPSAASSAPAPPTSGGSGPTGFPSSIPGSSSAATSGSGPNSASAGAGSRLDLVLTTRDLPAGTDWTQRSEGELSNEAGTGQRLWASSTGDQALEVDVLDDGTAARATADYPEFRDSSGNTLAAVTSTPPCPTGAPANCTTRVGTTRDGKAEAILTYQYKQALVGIVLVNAGADVDVDYLSKVGSAQNEALTRVLG